MANHWTMGILIAVGWRLLLDAVCLLPSVRHIAGLDGDRSASNSETQATAIQS